MKIMKVFDTQWGDDPDVIKKALYQIGRDMELSNDSYFEISPSELEHEFELKDVADYFRSQNVAEEENILVKYWW
jgi:hypothetical protein